jgi:outer membrane protein assembly factor BamE (lipoprotein component of BamABCDE complex)
MAMATRSCFFYALLLAILVIVAAQLCLSLFGWWKGYTTHEQAQEQKLLARDEFKSMILGKTEDEVLAVAGKPSTTSQADTVSYWHFAERTRDPLTGQADSNVQVVFKQGRVVAVNY